MQKVALLLIQIPVALVIIAFVPTNLGKLAALATLFVLTFRKISKPELIFFIAICIFFTTMNAMSLKQGIFSFTSPDILGMPVYELFMWGFYLLHLKRVVSGPAPQSNPAVVWTLAILYSAAFATIQDSNTLLVTTLILLAITLAFFHEPHDLAYVGYLVLMGAAFEYTGVHSGEVGLPRLPHWRRALLVCDTVGWCGLVHAPTGRTHPHPLRNWAEAGHSPGFTITAHESSFSVHRERHQTLFRRH